MADIKITPQMINEYRAMIGNYVMSDSAISDKIREDIYSGKLPKEFATLATDVQKTGYNAGSSNLFGYGFNTDNNMGLAFERTISKEELEHKKNMQIANNVVKTLQKSTSGWNDLNTIEKEIKKINNPEIYELVNKILEEKGYKSDTFYSPLEKFLSEENNHFMRDSSDLNIIWEFFDNGALTQDEEKNMEFRITLRRIRDGKVNLEKKEHIKFLLDYIDYTDAKSCEKAILKITQAIEAAESKNDVYLTDLKNQLINNKNKVSHTIILDSVQKRIEETTGFSKQGNNKLSNNLDGRVDTDFKQGQVGDCWLIAAIKGIISNDTVRAVLEKECLKTDENGNRIVKLLGVGKEYTITEEELEANAYFSSGEDDVRAIEIAFEKFFIENKGYENDYNEEGITGGRSQDACEILLGEAGVRGNDFFDNGIPDSIIEQFNSENIIYFVSAHGEDKEDFYISKVDKFFNPAKKIVSKHAYYVVKADSENVYLVNPWDTSKQIELSRKTFKEFFNYVRSYELNNC